MPATGRSNTGHLLTGITNAAVAAYSATPDPNPANAVQPGAIRGESGGARATRAARAAATSTKPTATQTEAFPLATSRHVTKTATPPTTAMAMITALGAVGSGQEPDLRGELCEIGRAH